MMGLIRLFSEALITLLREEIFSGAHLVCSDDIIEVERTPSVILQGPILTENRLRRSLCHSFIKNGEAMTYEEHSCPRLYHLDFELIITTAHYRDLLEFMETSAACFAVHRTISTVSGETCNLTGLIPAGGVSRVNLSDLKQSTGKVRIEDCPVFAGDISAGKLIRNRIISAGEMNTLKGGLL